MNPLPQTPNRFSIPFRWDVFWKKQRVLFTETGFFRPLPALLFHLGLYGTNQIGWGLDGILPSTIRTPQLDNSVFIVGHQRSGTTFLHRLLYQNEWAHSLQLQEMLFPSNTLQECIGIVNRMDSTLGGNIRKWFQQIQERTFADLDKIHRVRFDEPEEDELVMWAIYASDMCINDNPTLIEMGLEGMPKTFEHWSKKHQQSALMWYRSCVHKKIQRTNGDGLYVGKNPRFSRCLPLLDNTFPNSKIIVLIRNPIEAIVSRMSLMKAIWTHRNPNFGELSPNHVQWILNNSIETYLQTEKGLQTIPEHRKIVIGYNALKATPRLTVQKIQRHFEFPEYTPSLMTELSRLEEQPYRSKHQYDLQQFGLHESQIREPLAEVFSRYHTLLNSE